MASCNTRDKILEVSGSDGIIAGVTTGLLFVAALTVILVVAVFLVLRRKRKRRTVHIAPDRGNVPGRCQEPKGLCERKDCGRGCVNVVSTAREANF